MLKSIFQFLNFSISQFPNFLLFTFYFSLLLHYTATPLYGNFTDVLPKGTLLIDSAYSHAVVRHRYNSSHELTNVVDDYKMYEPTGELQGTIKAPARSLTIVDITQLFYGITDDWSIGAIIPYFLSHEVKLNLGWEPGDYVSVLGRQYEEEDFWQWADSMGQPKPQNVRENKGVLGDIIIGSKYRFKKSDKYAAGMVAFVSTRSGISANPERLGSVGTTGFDNGTNGDLGARINFDLFLLNKRLTVGGELGYEYFFERELNTPRGVEHSLLLTYAPYVGGTHKIKPGDWWGATVGFDLVPIKGPTKDTWITAGDMEMAQKLPYLFVITVWLNYTRLLPSDYASLSEYWDSEQEKENDQGYRNKVTIRATLNMFRLGMPFGLYLEHANQEIVPGKNFLPVVSWVAGLQMLYKF